MSNRDRSCIFIIRCIRKLNLIWILKKCPMNYKFNTIGSWSNMYCFLTSRRLKAIFSGHMCFLIIHFYQTYFKYRLILLMQFSLIFKMRLSCAFSCARARSQAAARECHYVTRGHVTGRQVRQADWVPLGRSRRRRTVGQLKRDTDCQHTDKVGHKLLLMAEVASFWESLLPLPRHRQPWHEPVPTWPSDSVADVIIQYQ